MPVFEGGSMGRLSARWLIVVGVGLSALGVLFYYQLERHSYYETGDLEFAFLSLHFFPPS